MLPSDGTYLLDSIIAGLVLRTRKCSAYARGVDASVHAQIDTQQHNQSRSRFTAALLCCQVHGVRS